MWDGFTDDEGWWRALRENIDTAGLSPGSVNKRQTEL